MKASGSKSVNDSQTPSIVGDSTPTRLCYVDDSRTSAYVVKRLLRPYGYIVDHFNSAEPALISLVQENYDLLLTDLKVSATGMDGDDLVRALRNTGDVKISSMPIIVITGATDKKILTEVYAAGANQIMNKPVSGDELDEEIRKLVFSRKQKETGDNQIQNSTKKAASKSKGPVTPKAKGSVKTNDRKVDSNQEMKSGGTVIPFGTESINTRLANTDSEDVAESIVLEGKVEDIPTLGASDQNSVEIHTEQNSTSLRENETPDGSSKPQRRVIKPNYTSSGSVRPQPAAEVKPASRVKPRIESYPQDFGQQGASDSPKKSVAGSNKIKVSNPVVDGSSLNATVAKRTKQLSANAKAALVAKKKTELAKKIRQAKIQKARLAKASRLDSLTLEPLNDGFDKAVESQDIFTAAPSVDSRSDQSSTKSKRNEIKENKSAEKSHVVEDFVAPPPQFGIDQNTNILHEMEKYPLVEADLGSNYSPSKIVSTIGSVLELYGLKRILMSFALLIGAYFIYLMFEDYFHQGIDVEVAVVEQGEIFQSITYPGKVVSKLKVNVTPSISGRLTKIYVEEGDTVKSGDLLARLDDREAKSYLARANASYNSAREEVIMAERTLKRLKQAFSKGAVAKQLVEDAEVELRSSKARRSIADEEVQTSKLTLENPKIVAPFSGTITAKYAEVGQWVVPSETLFTLIDQKQREIEVNVDAADSGGIAVGQTVGLSSDAFPGLEWSESVTRLAAATSNVGNANTVSVFISLGSNAPSLRFGQQVDADIRTAWNPNAIKVPYAAISNRKGSSWVATIDKGKARFIEVETGIEDYTTVEILHGVNVGQTVILTNGLDLAQGDKVNLASKSM